MSRDGMTQAQRRVPRGLSLALFFAAMAWVGGAHAIAGRAAQGIAARFQVQTAETLLNLVFLLFLVVVGFGVLDLVAGRATPEAEVLPLPFRAGWGREWGVGAALGWGLCLMVVLPVLITRNLHTRLTPLVEGAWGAALLALASLLVAALLEEVIFRGYPLQRLRQAIGSPAATLLLSIGFGVALVFANPPRHLLLAVIDGSLFGLLLTMAYLRTHALWVGGGIHFAYRAVMAVVLGLPIAGLREFETMTSSSAGGPRWLSGGSFGLDAALLTALVLLAGMLVLYRVTKEYAWNYTHAAILPGGYEVVVAPPAAHVAMEKAAAPPALVQIASSTPPTRSPFETREGAPPLHTGRPTSAAIDASNEER